MGDIKSFGLEYDNIVARAGLLVYSTDAWTEAISFLLPKLLCVMANLILGETTLKGIYSGGTMLSIYLV